MTMLQFIIGTVTLLLATCTATPQCPNGTRETENATAIIDKINQSRRKLADGLQATADGALLPPAKVMGDLDWGCEVEEALVEMTSTLCSTPGDVYVDFDYTFLWFFFNPANDESLLGLLTEQFALIEDEAPLNITSDAVVYYDNNESQYNLKFYLNFMRASTKKFACIKIDGECYVFDTDNLLLFCGTEQAELKNGDIVYEIAKATTSTATTDVTLKPVTSSIHYTTTSMTASTSPSSITKDYIITSSMTSSSSTYGLNATQCAIPSTTPKCATVPSRKIKRDTKVALLANIPIDKSNSARKEAATNTHHKQLRHPETPMVPSARRTRAARTATAKK